MCIEAGHRQDFNDYELTQEEYLRIFDLTENIEKPNLSEKSDIQDR